MSVLGNQKEIIFATFYNDKKSITEVQIIKKNEILVKFVLLHLPNKMHRFLDFKRKRELRNFSTILLFFPFEGFNYKNRNRNKRDKL